MLRDLLSFIAVLTIILNLVTEVNLSAEDKLLADCEYYTIGDYMTHYRFQKADGESVRRVVFIHGFTTTTQARKDMSSIMCASEYDCLLIDLPSFGYNAREAIGTEHSLREDIVTSLVKYPALGERRIVAGHSMGGGVSLILTTKHTEQVSAMLLYASGGDHIPEPLLYHLNLVANAALCVTAPDLSSYPWWIPSMNFWAIV